MVSLTELVDPIFSARPSLKMYRGKSRKMPDVSLWLPHTCMCVMCTHRHAHKEGGRSGRATEHINKRDGLECVCSPIDTLLVFSTLNLENSEWLSEGMLICFPPPLVGGSVMEGDKGKAQMWPQHSHTDFEESCRPLRGWPREENGASFGQPVPIITLPGPMTDLHLG